MASPITELEEVPEGSTPLLTATVQDETGAAIPGTSLDAATLTLVEESTGQVINGRDEVDITGDISALGVLSRRLTSADTKHITTATTEYHRAIIQWDYDTDGHGIAILRWPVVDIAQVV